MEFFKRSRRFRALEQPQTRTVHRSEQSANKREMPPTARLLARLVILALPFSSAFAPSARMPINLTTILLFALAFILSRRTKVSIGMRGADILLVVTLGLGLLGYAFAPSWGARSFNHTLAITTCIGFYYFFLRKNLYERMGLTELSRWLCYSASIAACFIIAEFIAANALGIHFREWIPYIEIRQSLEPVHESTFAGRWTRPRGFAIEAGHMATFFEAAIPLSWLWLRTQPSTVRILFWLVVGCGFLLLASAAGITALLVGGSIVWLRNIWNIKVALAVLGAVLIGVAIVTVSPDAREMAATVVVSKTLGFFGLTSDDDHSASDRSARALAATEIASTYLMGMGWGTAAHVSVSGGLSGFDVPFGFISLYAEVLVAGGWLGLLSFVLFLGSNILRLLASSGQAAQCTLWAALSLSIHYGTLSNYWFPAFWLPFAIVDMAIRRSGK